MRSPSVTLLGGFGREVRGLVRGHCKFIVLHSFTSIHSSPWLERECWCGCLWIDIGCFHWCFKDLVEMVLPFKIALIGDVHSPAEVQVSKQLFQLTLNPPGPNVQLRNEMSSLFFHTQAGKMILTDRRRSGFPASSTLTPVVNLSKDRGLIFISAEYKQPLLKPKGAVSFQDLPPIPESSTKLILFRWTSLGNP